MLPYHLRVPVYGKSNEHIKKSSEEEKSLAARGGPVQAAIEDDILLLQAKYVKHLQYKRQQQTHDGNEGFAFGIFRELFAKSKVAMLHLLLPKTSCDKEAYSQLTYAACFQVLRQAFTETNGAGVSLEKAGFALFCLYALYETNPLPRETKSPFELLSMGLQGDENYRALYRRVFKQKIRIDHEHYARLLRLRQLCLARIDGCGKKLYGRKEPIVVDGTFNCSCGISRDTIHIMDKLATKWDYCDYTGPVGLEGLAGHSGYVATESTITTSTASVALETTISSTEFTLSAELKQSLQAYQSRVRDIRVPAGRTHTATKVRKCLEDFFAKTRQDPLSQVEARLFGTAASGQQETQEVPDELALQDNAAGSNDTYRRVFVDGENDTARRQNAIATLPSFKSTVPPELHNDTKKFLHQALGSLFKRQLPLLQATAVVGGEPADDVSSVGFGGISLAPSGGRNALQALLSKANANKGIPSRVGATNSTSRRQTDKNASIQFLTAENTLSDEPLSDDEGSDVSNMSISDYEDDDENAFDDVSIATSAAGKQALSSLFNRVKNTQTHSQKRINSKKRKPIARKNSTQRVANLKPRATSTRTVDGSRDTASTGTSIGCGQNALAALLGEAQETELGNEGETRTTVRRKSKRDSRRQTKQSKRARVSKEATREPDGHSMASTIGNGQNALENLVAQARNSKDGTSSNLDAMSVASSVGQGKGALANLLSSAGGETKFSSEENTESASFATSLGQGQGALNALLEQSASQHENDCDSESIATSIGPGKGALDALLKGASQTYDDD